jgi:hypothetical protein
VTGGRRLIKIMLPKFMPDLDQLMSALFLVALLLYLVPAVFGLSGSAEGDGGSNAPPFSRLEQR